MTVGVNDTVDLSPLCRWGDNSRETSVLCRQSTLSGFCRSELKRFLLFFLGELPNSPFSTLSFLFRLRTPEPDPPLLMPVSSFFFFLSPSFLFLPLKWVVQWAGRGGVLLFSTLLPLVRLETCFNRESMQCILLCCNPPLHCIWGIRGWTSGGITHTFPIRRGGRERRGGRYREERERERLPFSFQPMRQSIH